MKPTHSRGKTRIKFISIKFAITTHELEYATQILMEGGNSNPNAKDIEETVRYQAHEYGIKSGFEGILMNSSRYEAKAKDLCKKLFPDFY